MNDALMHAAIAASALAGLVVIALVALRAWRDWLDLQRLQLGADRPQPAASLPAARIELADLRERVRKLEAIAAGVDL